MTPERLLLAAQNLANNEDLSLLLDYKLKELANDVLYASEDKDILSAQKEYTHIQAYGEWITALGKIK